MKNEILTNSEEITNLREQEYLKAYNTAIYVMQKENKNIMELNRRERAIVGEYKDYLDVAIEAAEKFDSEFEGIFDGPTLVKKKQK